MTIWSVFQNPVINGFCADVCVYVCVFLPPRLLITSGVIWTTVEKFYSCYIFELESIVVNGRGLGTDIRCTN